MLRVVVDTDSGLAPWRQVHGQIVGLITNGELPTGFRMPPIRQLSRDLGLASGTVARVYRELEVAGWVSTARGGGTVVAELSTAPDPDTELRLAAEEYVARARALGADAARASAAMLAAFEADHPQ
jgi:DNA-binding transcriptional regulator YhcF (GntR family)